MKRFLLALLISPAALGATYNVALPGGGVLTVNGAAYTNPAITNSASVVWGVDGAGFLYATATGTNSSIIYVEGSAVAGPNFGLSTEVDPVVTAATNITFSLVNNSITTNKIDSTFYTLLMQSGAGDVTAAGNNTFTGTNVFSGPVSVTNLTIDTADIVTLTLDNPIGVTAVGTNAADARVQLGVRYDVDVQAYHLELLQAALALTANGHMVYHNGTLVTNLLSTTPGRYLLTAVTAADQRNALVVGELDQSAYGAGWSGETGKVATLDALYNKFESLPGGSNNISSWNPAYFDVTGGYLDWVGGSSGGGGFVYILTNSLGAWQGRDTSTNWTILSTTISSNDLPTATGRFIEGGWSLVASNYSGTAATLYLNVLVGGTLVFSDSYSLNSVATAMRPMAADFRFVRESESTASLVHIGQNVNSSSTPTGIGDFSSTASAATIVTTNITVDWTGNLAFSVEMYCDTSVATNTALGIRPVSAWMRRDATASSGSGDVVGPESSTTNNIAVFADATGKLLADGGVAIAELATVADPVFTGTATFDTINTSTLTVTNPFPARGITNATASRFAVWGADNHLTNDVAETGTGAPVRAVSPALTGTPTVNGTNLMAAIASAGGGAVATDSIWTTKGDLAVGTGTATAQRLGVGTQGQTPLADTNATTGISWGTPRGISSIRNFYLTTDFEPDTAVGTFDVALPWKGGAISSGTVALSAVEGLTNHWGVARVSSAAGANSGWKYALTQYGLQIGGQGEQAWHAWRPVSTNNGIITKLGFVDSITTTESTDAVAFMRTNNLLSGVCRSNNVQLSTASTYTIASNVWYYAQVEATAPTTATFRLYGDDWTLLWTDTVTGGIPLGRSIGHGYVGFATNAVGVVLDDLDFFSVEKQGIR